MKKEIPFVFLRHLTQRHRQVLEGSGLSLRAVLAGLCLVLCVCLGAPYSIWIVGSSELTWSYFPIGVGAPFFAVVLANALLRRLWPGGALKPAELITAVIMGLAASGIPIFVVGYILSIISKPYYGAQPHNKWATHIQPHLPEWAVPGPSGDAMRFFYEGLPERGAAIPWGTWIGPLAWWLGLVLALYLVCFCLVAVLRRQWMERERLVFPLTEVPLMLTRTDGDGALPTALRGPHFWIGCAVPLAFIAYNMIGYFAPGFAQIPVFRGTLLRLVDHAPPINLLVYFPVIGFMYLVPTAVSFSVWFFFLVHVAQSGLFHTLGLPALRPDPFVIGGSTLSWQSWGAFVAMVLWSLYLARHHLAAVGRKAIGRGAQIDDGDEMVPYRLAVVGGLAGTAFILLWLWRSGLDLHWAGLYLAAALIVFLGITRLVVQAGMHYLTTPMTAQSLTLALSGSGIGPQNLVALALTYAWCGDVQSTFMPTAANALKLHADYTHRRNLGLLLAIGLAVVAGFVATAVLMIYLCYDYGAINLRSWFFNAAGGAGGRAFDAAVQQMNDPFPTDWDKLGYFGGGALLYSLLHLLHLRLSWWSLHPVGLAVASTWMMQRIAFSVFLAWAFKRLILRYGGVGLYGRLKPFFIGLAVGFFAGVGLGFAVDALWFFGKGHPILHG